MIKRFTLAKGALTAAAAAMALSTGLAAPQLAMAQPYNGPPPPGAYPEPCQQQQTDHAIAGGVLGAVAGAVIGNNIGTGPGRAGGSIIGGLAGAAVGAKIGQSTAACDDQGPPPPPPPPQVVYRDYGPPPPPPPPRCGRAENRIYYPDGTVESYPVRACRGPDGRWFVSQ